MQDLRYAIRVLLKSPAVTVVAVISLALGIGANATIFSVINALMLRPLPFHDPGQLVKISTISPETNADSGPLSLAMLNELRRSQTVFSSICAWTQNGLTNFEANGGNYLGSVSEASGDYFTTLGVRPELGRLIGIEDAPLGAAASAQVAVLDYRAWQNWYQADPRVIGKQVRINGRSFTVIGVTPKNYGGLRIDSRDDAVVPVGFGGTESIRDRKFLTLYLFARMKPGVSLARARAQIATLWPAIQKATIPDGYAGAARERFFKRRIAVDSEASGSSFLRQQYGKALTVLMGLVGMVLLIACVNLANLMLARAAGRQQEIGVRAALGASAWRLVRQFLIESMLLSFTGAMLGVLLAIWTARALVNTMWIGYVPLNIDPWPDIRVVVFTTLATILTGVLFGLAPAAQVIRMSRYGPLASLTQNSRSVRGGGWFGKALVSVQVALSMVMLLAAALFIHSLQKIHSIDPGFRRQGVLLVQLFPQPGPRQIKNKSAYYRQLSKRISQLPGVQSNTYTNADLIAYAEFPSPVASTSTPLTEAVVQAVGPGFFQLLGIRMLKGREFDDRDDENSPHVAVISESLARQLFPSTDPIGQQVQLFPGPAHRAYQVVGVSANASLWRIQNPVPQALFIPQLQDPSNTPLMVIRTAAPPLSLAKAVEKEVEALGSHHVLRSQTLQQRSDRALLQERMVALLSAFFGGLAVLLACIGLYGLTAYSVTRRTAEIGVRMALGAERSTIIFMVLREVAVMVMAGILIGVPAALAGSRLISGMLFGLSPDDPATIAAACAGLSLVALCAGFIPARQASRIQPTEALRTD